MPIPEWYHPIPDADPEAFSQAASHQLDLAQRDYDPQGIFAQRLELSWLVHANRDTRGVAGLPVIYQTEATNVNVEVAEQEGLMEVRLGVKAKDEKSRDLYTTANEDHIPLIVALLGKIADIELAELETHPRRVLHTLGETLGGPLDPATGFERAIIQKTLELPDAPGGAINLQYFKFGSVAIEARFARQVALPEGTVLYQNNIMRDGRQPDALYCWPRAFMLQDDLAMGKAYHGAERDAKMSELVYRPRGQGEMSMSDFEERLRQAGNVLIGVVEAADISRLVSEPLSEQYRLHL